MGARRPRADELFPRTSAYASTESSRWTRSGHAAYSPALMDVPAVRLTSLSHGGGCGCKLAPSVLQQLLANQPAAPHFANLLVGTETSDDAAVWRLVGDTCVIATTDFFMPIVDDPGHFGRIAAT